MISILIPIFNFDILELVSDLYHQAVNLNIDFEIICIDDCSSQKFNNHKVTKWDNIFYEELSLNLGRSKIRNYLADKSKYEYLLFMDCDSAVLDDNYLKNYINQIIKNDACVICGGRIYSNTPPEEKNKILHWKIGSKREVTTAIERNKFGYSSFMSNNFIVKKEIFNEIRFDEQLNEYGHEDTLFGEMLNSKNTPIIHIDNPLIHIGLENDIIFLEKTSKALNNIINLNLNEKKLKTVKIYNFYVLLKNTKLIYPFCLLYRIFKKLIVSNLLSGNPIIILFDFFKINELSKHDYVKK